MEKFLELNSEQNHDDYCLAYVFTDRDFDDGVLGLAWVGAPSGTVKLLGFSTSGGGGGANNLNTFIQIVPASNTGSDAMIP